MEDSEKLRILASWLASSKEPEILTRIDHVLITDHGRRMVVDDLKRIATMIDKMHELADSGISIQDFIDDYYIKAT